MNQKFKIFKIFFCNTPYFTSLLAIVFSLGTALILAQAVPFIRFEAEGGTLSTGANSAQDTTASGGSYVAFHNQDTSGQIPADQLPKGNPLYADSRILLSPTPVGPLSGDGTGNFRTTCEFSHMSYDDPIVYPGQPGAAHLHTFFGNTGANYASTHTTLTAAGTKSTCSGGAANLSSYWFPSLMNGNTPVVPHSMGVYYKSQYLPAASMNDIPQGLKMVAGNHRSLVGQNPHIVYWECIGHSGGHPTTMPACPAGALLMMDVKFPQCWDGVSLDAPDHISHVRYPGLDPQPPGTVGHWGDGCSKEVGHHTPIPEITIKAVWTVPPGGSANLRLSSDMPGALPGASAHADYMEGWNRPILQRFMQHCIRTPRDTTNSLCDGQELIIPNQFQWH